MRLLVVCAVAVWPTLAAALSPLTPQQSQALQQGLVTTADEFIVPAYQAQASATQELTETLGRYCAGDAAIQPAKAAFTAAFLAWQRASVIQFGPVGDAEGLMRVQMWPDPKGFARRAVRTALRQEADALVAAGGLRGRSVALTGFTALEFLLFSDLQPNTYGCELALAIAALQAELAAEFVTAWTPGSTFRTDYDGAVEGNDRYRQVDDLVREFLAGTVAYVDQLRRFKLLRGLGDAEGEARPERTEAQLSGNGLASITASFHALADLYAVPGGLFDVGDDIGGSGEHVALGSVAAAIADRLNDEDAPLTDIAAEDGDAAASLRRYANLVAFQEAFLKTGFTGSLGLSAGFTSADGD